MANCVTKLEVAEQVITDFINNRATVGELEKVLSDTLSDCDFFKRKKKFTVSLVRTNKSKEPFFGARVFPTVDMIESIVSETVVECHPLRDLSASWAKIDEWVIELDSAMFDRQSISLVPKEIVAAILHEVGHTVYSDKVLERFYRSYRSMQVHMKSAEKETVRLGYSVFAIPLSVSCGIRSWTRGRNGIKEEMFADTIVRENGYGDFYVSLLSKIIEAYGNGIVDGSEAESDNKVSERTRWATTNMIDAVRRRTKMKDDLYLEAARTPSEYLKALHTSVMHRMGIGLRERYSGDAVECSLTTFTKYPGEFLEKVCEAHCDTDTFRSLDEIMNSIPGRDKYRPGTPAFEAIFTSKFKRGLPSQLDIDRIQIDIDRMSNHHDRSFVLDLIYNKMDDITQFMEYAEGAKIASKYEAEARRMMDQLNDMREQVLRKNNFAMRYAVFAKVPAGYEG